jgi:hypothetical protein
MNNTCPDVVGQGCIADDPDEHPRNAEISNIFPLMESIDRIRLFYKNIVQQR